MFRFRVLATLVALQCLNAQSVCAELPPKLPKDALELLHSFPGKKLSVDVVIQRAIQSSDNFRLIQSQMVSADAPMEQSEALTEARVYLKGSHLLSRLEPTNSLGANRSVITNYFTLGVSKLFSTGTALGVELAHNRNEINFTVPVAGQVPNFETLGKLSFTQNLWQDAFGKSTRSALTAGRLGAAANRVAFEESVEAFVVDLIQVYYSAWLSQARVEAATDGLGRRKRLLNITQIKLRRGTSERPDLLQVQSAYNQSVTQRDQSIQTLGDVWRNLVTSLKLPHHWIAIDPTEIPLMLDAPVERAVQACGDPAKIASAPRENTSSRRARLQLEAAQASLSKAMSDAKPDLELAVGLQTNEVDPAQDPTFRDLAEFDHPAWQVGVNFSMPLGFHVERANVLTAKANEIRAEAQASQTSEGLVTSWVNSCTEFWRSLKAYELAVESSKLQAQRAALEEVRFKIGRSGTLQVIQAGDDATFSEMSMRQGEVERRLAAWKVLQLTGAIRGYVEGLAAKAGPKVGS